MAKNTEKAGSDVDLVIIGEIGMRALTKLLSGLQEKIGREINPHIYTEIEFAKKVRGKDHLVTSILKTELKPLLGNVDD